MKRCPECRRDYYDETLMYCLDDGSALLEGPASADEAATATLPISTRYTADDADEADRHATSGVPEARDENKRHKIIFIVGVVGAFILVAVGGLVIYRALPQPPVPFSSVKVRKLTNMGNIASAAISPNGETLAATLFENGKTSIRIWDIASGSNTQIMPPTDDGLFVFAYSSDGRSIFCFRPISFFTTSATGVGDVYEIGVYGGPSKKLLEKVSSAALSKDGKYWAFVRSGPESDENSLFISKIDGSEEKKITTLKASELNSGAVTWSPDGKSIAFGISTDGLGTSLSTVSIEDGKVTPITSKKWFLFGDLIWLPKGDGYVFVAADSFFGFKVWYMSYPGGELKSLTNETFSPFGTGLSISADSSIIATTPAELVSNIFLAPVDNPSLAKTLPGETVNTATPRNFSLTPDGRIVYASLASGNSDIWIQNSDGSGKKQLTNDPAFDSYPRVSPDGSSLVFESTRSGSFDIWRMNIDGSEQRRITNGGINFKPDFSPDGQWVIYGDWVNSQLRKIPIDGGEPAQLTDRAADWHSVSRKTGMIAGMYRPDPASPAVLAVFGPDGGSPIKTFSLPPGSLTGVHWMPDEKSIVYPMTRSGASSIWSQSLDGGQPKQLADFSPEYVFTMGLSRDGRTIVFSKGKIIGDVVLIADTSKD